MSTAETEDTGIDSDLVVFGGVDQRFLEYPQPHYARMRARRPLLRVPGAVQTTTRAALDAALRSPEIYSSGMDGAPLGNDRPLIPLQIDPPDQLRWRKLLDPLFTPKKMATLAPQIAAQVNELIDGFIDRGSCDFTNEFAIPLPSVIFLRLFGLPLEELDRLLEFNERTQRPRGARTAEEQLEKRRENARDVYRYFETVIAARRAQAPRDDLLSVLLTAEVDGRPLTDEEITDISFLMILAGLDTITDTLTCSFKFLAEHPEHRRRIVDDPPLIASAVEELLRWETPVMTVIRVARRDSAIEGCPVRDGDAVLACLGSANTDETEFAHADVVDFERNPNRHVAFGAGVHRCLGSHLARQELRVALAEWHRRIPDYELPEGFVPKYSDGLRSVRNLRLEFPAGGKARPAWGGPREQFVAYGVVPDAVPSGTVAQFALFWEQLMSEAVSEPVPTAPDLEGAPPAQAAVAQSHAPASSHHLGLALAVISAAQLMVVLDASIVNVALPSIQHALHFGAANLVWVINGYTLTFGGLLLLGGRTGDLFGRRRMFMIGVGIFTAASLLGGLATTEGWLIGARMLQGAGGAIMAPTALSLIASTFPEGSPARNRAMGVYAAMSGAGGAIGVLLGGILTDTLSWRWVLFVNVPIGLGLVLGAPRAFAETETRRGRLDLPGAVLATGGMTLVVYGLIHAASTSWGDRWTIGALVVGAALLASFLVTEARSPHALLPLRLFRDRNRATAYAMMLALATAMFSMFYFLTLFFQEILGFSPLRAGLGYLPFALTIIITATLVSRVVGRTGPKLPMMVGTTFGTTGLLWFSFNSASASYWGNVLVPMVLLASGMAMNFVPLTLTAVRGVARQDQGIASALLNSGQQVGGSLGLAVLGTIAIDVTRGKLDALGNTGAHFVGSAPPPQSAQLPPALHHAIYTAYMSGYTTAFRVGAGLMFLAFLLATLVIRNPRPAAAAPAEAGATEPQLSTATA